MASNTKLNEKLRAEITKKLIEILSSEYDDVMQISSHDICFPITDEENNDKFIKISVIVPTSADFDGYESANDFIISQKEKMEKQKVKEEEKARVRV